MSRVLVLLSFLTVLLASSASAWNAPGHKVVGSIADHLLNANASQQVARILGFDLSTAATWLDCVKSVEKQDNGTFAYKENPEFEPPCAPFRDERDRIVDYAKRNWVDCSYVVNHVDRGCHNTYHFSDVPVQRNRFDRNYQGTNTQDVVAAINAAIAVLLDRPAPPPFSIIDKKEALFLLAHLVGDLHQPLHVAAVYLDKNGGRVDPDITHTVDPATETTGGNSILDQGKNFHGEWDAIPEDIGEAATPKLVAMARSVRGDRDRIENWSVAWATDSVRAAHAAFSGLKFGYGPNDKWTVDFRDRELYVRAADALKREQLAKAGARLAELLNAIWR